ncbi:MAG: hypothetical protein AB9866_28015 [Syntrophobacteraceae bacterium]
MKAIAIQQPFAYEMMTGFKTIEACEADTLHRGDILVCSSRKPALSEEEMTEMEEEYGCDFLYGQALFVARLVDVRLMQEGDEEAAMVLHIDPEAYSWIFEDIRPVIPFPVKGRDGVFEVEDHLITMSPFRYDEPVVVKPGTIDQDFGMDFSGWHGRSAEIVITDESHPRIRILWDSQSLKLIPTPVLEKCEKEGFDWTAVLLRLSEIDHAEPRDTWEDVHAALEEIVEKNPDIFGE